MKKITLLLLLIITSLVAKSQTVFDYINSGNEKGKNKDYEGAIKAYDSALVLKPDFTMVMNMKGLCLVELHRDKEACELFNKAKSLGSGKAQGYIDTYCANIKSTTETDCKMARQGKFKYLTNDSDTSAFILRKGDYHTEYFEGGKYYSKFKMYWLSDCEYELTFIETNDPKLDFLKKGDVVRVKVSNVTATTYDYESNLNGVVMKGTHRKVSE